MSFESALQAWKRLLDTCQLSTGERRGLLGDGIGNTAVPSRPGWNYIRYEDDLSKLSIVRNMTLGYLGDGTPVIVGKNHPTDDSEQVLRINWGPYSYNVSQALLDMYATAPHGDTHHGGIGSDPAPIDLNNLVNGKIVPTDPPSLVVEAYMFIYADGLDVLVYAGGFIDLTAHVPGGAGHRYALVYFDIATATLQVVISTVVPLAVAPDIPSVPSGGIPLGLVTLYFGQTTIRWDNTSKDILQYKLLWGSVGGSVPPHTHSDEDSGGSSIIDLQELMFLCHVPIFMVGNSIWPTHVYHTIYIPTMYASWPEIEADLVWIHAGECGQILIIRPADPGLYTKYIINVRHGVGNIRLFGESDVVLDEGSDHLMLIYDGEYWCDFACEFSFTDGLKVGDVEGGNFTHIESDGTVEFNGDATVWNDIYFPMSSGKIGGANQPTWAAFQGNTMEYTFAINDYIHLPSQEIAHSYKEGSNIVLHVHIVLDGSDVGDTDVNYEIEYTIGDIDEVMSGAAVVTSGDYTITGGLADRMHLYIPVATIDGTNLLIQTALKMRFRRIALVGGGNAPSNAPFVLMVGAHIEEDTVGSRAETAK